VIEARRPRLTQAEKDTIKGGRTPADWTPARRAVGRCGSAQVVLCSAKKLSGGSASSGVNRGSKRKRVPQ
jgi:hypothetical protein